MELLLPVGDKDSFYQAVNNGADAVYLAGKRFGARAYAPNFSVLELKELIKEAHILGVKVYITVNTIIKEKELIDAISFIREIANAGADAFIMQDVGLISITRRCLPTVTIHASTNLNANSIEKVKELSELGVKRVILPRELSIEEIKIIKENADVELEVFVHGAICISYSGRCLFSSSIGGRSGNRGTCAQTCRMEFNLKKDNEVLPKKHYLSPRDLCTIEHIAKLKELGIDSIKIEGRMKRSSYIAVVARSYRKALDNDLSKEELVALKKEMALMFNRGYSKGHLFGSDISHFTNTSFSSHVGVNVGEVQKWSNNYAFIKLSDDLRFGDSVRIVGSLGDAITINEMFVNGIKKKEAHAGDFIQVRTHTKVMANSAVLKTTDQTLIDGALSTPKKQIQITGCLYYDDVVKLKVSDATNEVIVESSFPYTKAESKSSASRLSSQIEKTTDSHYKFSSVRVLDDIFMPIKEVNDLRRRALLALDAKRSDTDTKVFNALPREELVTGITNVVYYSASTEEQIKKLLSLHKVVLTRNYSLYKKYSDDGVAFLPKRINNYGYNFRIIDNYHNVLNSSSCAYYFRNGAEVVGVSVEASYDNICDIVKGYEDAYLSKPNLMVMIYGYQELMVTKHCLICKEMGHNEKGCKECEKHNFSLIDRKGEEYRLINDGNCNLTILNSKVLNLIRHISDFKRIGVTNFFVDLKTETEEEIEKIVDAIDNQRNIHFTNETIGYFEEEVI